MARITGIGGIFIKSPDPKALSAWYRDTLGMAVEDWGGTILKQSPQSPTSATWSPFEEGTKYFAPSTRDVMINFAVDDLDAYLAIEKHLMRRRGIFKNEVVRGPVYGYLPGMKVYLGTVVVTVALYMLAIPLLIRFRQRIAFWV